MQPAAARVQDALRAFGLGGPVIELGASARTAAEAAAACGVSVAQIVKSLVFLAGTEPILVLTSGANQVDETRLHTLTGQPIRRADADVVRAATGFAIGGVPPVGHARTLRTVIDRDLLAHDELIAAAGTPNAVFRLTPDELCRVTGGVVEDVKRLRSDAGAGHRGGASPSCG
jgi:prolyl-tRNA editing enzyme YbaK/EbsC (Cys-tRNA(Pro) deacylase)